MLNIGIYNVKGRRIRDLLNERRNAGIFQVIWDGFNNAGEQVPSGVYITKVTFSNQTKMIKMLLVR